jgi:ADP-ribose pyrophosphatase YjhB (NUDIX family)
LHKLYIVIRQGHAVVLWRMCWKAYPNGIGKWTVPGGAVWANETLTESALRIFKEDVKCDPDPDRLLLRFNHAAYEEETNAKFTAHYFEYVWSSDQQLPPFTPGRIVDQREVFPAGSKQFPPFHSDCIERAVHYVLMSWRYS